MKITAEERAQLGSKVAKVKADLHEAENMVTSGQLEIVDWAALAASMENLATTIRCHIGQPLTTVVRSPEVTRITPDAVQRIAPGIQPARTVSKPATVKIEPGDLKK